MGKEERVGMAKIVFYDATDVDIEQLSQGLSDTDHYWEYCPEKLSAKTVREDAEVISVFVTSPVTAEMMARMPRLKLIATRSTGFDHIDLDYAKAHDITLTNVPIYGENTVAEYAFALLFNISRHMNPAIRDTKRGVYQARNFVGFDLKDKTIGIIGMGNIGRHTAKIAHGLDMNILAYDLHEDAEFAEKCSVDYVPLDELLATSDIISMHTPLLPSTRYIINDETIGKMKDGVILINTARGELVDNKALIRGLKSGKIGGAGLDTIEGERYLARDVLCDALIDSETSDDTFRHASETLVLQHMPNVIVTEHCAYDTYEAIARINGTTAQNIIDFWYDKTPNKIEAK